MITIITQCWISLTAGIIRLGKLEPEMIGFIDQDRPDPGAGLVIDWLKKVSPGRSSKQDYPTLIRLMNWFIVQSGSKYWQQLNFTLQFANAEILRSFSPSISVFPLNSLSRNNQLEKDNLKISIFNHFHRVGSRKIHSNPKFSSIIQNSVLPQGKPQTKLIIFQTIISQERIDLCVSGWST